MKKIVIALFALAAFTVTANAQETRKMNPHRQMHGNAMMMKELNLSAAQREQLEAARETTKMQLAELNKNENITVKEYKAKKAAILKTQKEAMEQVLTAEQKKQLAEARKNFKAKHEQFSAKRLESMKTNLNLSDDQVAKIKANHEASQAKAKTIFENSQLTPAEKKEQLMAMRKEQKESFKQVLTPEQINKMEELKKQRMDKRSK
ncbi:MAG: hypothetical protein JWP81_1824 [Ferruginibacter sp.]|nr:hypothetical protein [Ferruginibacter sp.]